MCRVTTKPWNVDWAITLPKADKPVLSTTEVLAGTTRATWGLKVVMTVYTQKCFISGSKVNEVVTATAISKTFPYCHKKVVRHYP